MPRFSSPGTVGRPVKLRVALLGALLGAFTGVPGFAGEGGDGGDDSAEAKTVASIEDRLALGLKARRPEDVAWLERVAGMVREGRLPAKIVDSTYLWALRRRQAYPYPSFRRALEIQADRLGIEID